MTGAEAQELRNRPIDQAGHPREVRLPSRPLERRRASTGPWRRMPAVGSGSDARRLRASPIVSVPTRSIQHVWYLINGTTVQPGKALIRRGRWAQARGEREAGYGNSVADYRASKSLIVVIARDERVVRPAAPEVRVEVVARSWYVLPRRRAVGRPVGNGCFADAGA